MPVGKIEDYHIFQTSKEEDVMRTIRTGLQGADIPVENSKGEWGPGQEETNVRYAGALEMAGRHAVLKNGIKEIAHRQGKAVTFMAKWDYDLAGSSCYFHASLWDKSGQNTLFYNKGENYGMTPLMRHFMAGQLKYAGDITYFLAPYINSYKRFQVGTFAPTKIVWSRDNRTSGFRLCGEGSKAIRVECRIGGADLNPYLAFAALLAAGLAGIEDKLVHQGVNEGIVTKPPSTSSGCGLAYPELAEGYGYLSRYLRLSVLALAAPFVGDTYYNQTLEDVPKTLLAATERLDKSTMLRSALGDDVVDHYVHTARWEQFEYDRRVTDWELKRGFEKF